MNVGKLRELLGPFDQNMTVVFPDVSSVDYREVATLEVKKICMMTEENDSGYAQDCVVLEG